MKKIFLTVFCGFLIFGFANSSFAILIYELNLEYSGGTNPAGSRPWLVATFENDTIEQGQVNLKLEARGLTGNEFVSNWYFNIDPTYTNILTISPEANASPVIQNQYSAGPALGFDIEFNFPTSNSSGLRFGAESVLNYYFWGAGLDETDFDFLNASGSGPFSSAAHVQSIGLNSGSGWIGTGGSNTVPVPEPATMLLLSIGLSGLAFFGRKRSLK
jgi:hypothetical protein